MERRESSENDGTADDGSAPDGSAPGGSEGASTEHVVFVHAHPDDETIETGGTIALLVERGIPVTVVTASRGERGEVIPDALHHLRTEPTLLGRHREGELELAMRELGVTDHRYLGATNARAPGLAPRLYRDSGMQWGADGAPEPLEPLDPESLCAADRREVALDLLTVLRDVEATSVVTYNDCGGYGHPDHVAVHRVTLLAARDAGVPVFAIERPRSAARASIAAVAERGRFHVAENPKFTSIPDERITLTVDVSAQLPRKIAALRAHHTQVIVDGDQFGLSNGTGQLIAGTESYRRLELPRPGEPPVPLRQRLLGYLLAGLIGCVFGTVGTVAHRIEVVAGGVPIPIGLVLGLAMVTALLLGFRLVLRDRYCAASAAVGLLFAIAALTLPGAGGSVLFPDSILSLLWTILPTLVAVTVLAWPRLPKPRVDWEDFSKGTLPN